MTNTLRCTWGGCKRPVAFKVTTQHDNGRRDQVHFTCDRRDHQHGSRLTGWTEPTERRVTRWSLMGFTGTHTVEPVRACGHCGGDKPVDQSCGCFDNNCQ